MQFTAVEIRFIVTTKLNSTFTNDLKRKYFFSKNVHSFRLCSCSLGAESENDALTDVHADGQTDGWTDTQTQFFEWRV